MTDRPRLSIVLLTLNEGRNILACLDSLARQSVRDFEVIVIDANSDDDTLGKVNAAQHRFPVPLRLTASTRRLPIGEARNLGRALASAPNIAFISADAEVSVSWVEHALQALEGADMVFGRQLHEPHRWTFGAAVRGLRYDFPDGATDDALRYASNVAAAYRRQVLDQFPFDPWANAAEDLLLARRAADAGYRAVYEPRMLVHHHDVSSAREEMRKSVREGHGWALYRGELGTFVPVLLWGLALVVAVATFAVLPWWTALILTAVAAWAPALRRAVGHRHGMRWRRIVQGVVASPPFDVAFLVNYAAGLITRADAANEPPKTQETPE
jgi:glycosyltransferase involved in cell wall biosynthesis